MEVSINGGNPQMDGLWYPLMESPTKMDDLGVPLFQKTPISSHQWGHQGWWPAVAGQALQLAVFAWFEATPWNGHKLQPQKWSQHVHATIYTINIYVILHIQSYTPCWIIQIEHKFCVSCCPKDALAFFQAMAGEPASRQQITEM